MRQSIQVKISNAILDWRDAETVSLTEFPFPAVPGNQHNDEHRKPPEVKAMHDLMEGVAREQINAKAEDDHLGIRIAIVQFRRSADMDNLAKSIIDGLKQIAFKDDKVFDYTEQVRVRADKKEDVGFTVEILRLVAKREAWV
jgi:Holliday junction resolvase RusA-like endonuclease